MPRSAHRRLTSQAVQVDLRDLKARGWSMRLAGGSAQCLGDHVVIGWRGHRYAVPLTETAPQYGGLRSWFCCPQCGRRARIVYSPSFWCRRCSGMLHPSTRQTTSDRAMERAVGIRRSLGGSGSLLDPFPAKPEGMQRATWLRLFSKCQREERKGLLGAAAAIAKLQARL